MQSRPKKLLVISHTPHYRRGEQFVGWGATVRELDWLAKLFEGLVHLAPLHPGPAPSHAIPYSAQNIRFAMVEPSGGPRMCDKFSILFQYPSYFRRILRELDLADAVHIRCPANFCLLAMVILTFRSKPETRWIKYATNWQFRDKEAWSSTLQRWWLRRGWARARVTVNGEYLAQPPHVKAFLNPCLTDAEVAAAKGLATQKPGLSPLRLLFVGALDTNKGVLRALDIVRRVQSSGVNAQFEVVGDGPERPALERRIVEFGMTAAVTLHGWLPRTVLGEIYARNHLFLMTSQSEGWPKVLSEAMAYGVVPVASAISCIPDYLKKFQVGRTVPWSDLPAFAQAAVDYARAPNSWHAESARAVTAAADFTYSHYLSQVRALLSLPPDVTTDRPPSTAN